MLTENQSKVAIDSGKWLERGETPQGLAVKIDVRKTEQQMTLGKQDRGKALNYKSSQTLQMARRSKTI